MAQFITTQKSSRLTPGKLMVLLAGVAMAGSGGVTHTPSEFGYALPGIRLQSSPRTNAAGGQIRQVVTELKISHAAFARVLGVSRQALYNWLSGAVPSPRHQTMIAALHRAHEILSVLGVPLRPLLTQPFSAGRNFWQLVQDGQDPETLAHGIRITYERRADQRALMAQRLAAKRAKGAVADSTYDDLT